MAARLAVVLALAGATVVLLPCPVEVLASSARWCAVGMRGKSRFSWFRGGGWINLGQYCRSANRDGFSPEDRCQYPGFRLALVAVP